MTTATPASPLVPLGVAVAWAHERPERVTVCADAARLVGERVEIDTTLLDVESAAGLRAYWRSCQDLWNSLTSGAGTAGTRYVRSRRVVHTARQKTGRGGKVDLRAELDALLTLPGVSALVEALTEPEVDAASVTHAAAAVAGDAAQDADGAWVATFPIAAIGCGPELGGPAWPGEVQRSARVTVKHAGWRDRRLRRLAAVEIVADEVWPDPGSAAAR